MILLYCCIIVINENEEMHQSTAASPWWCGPQTHLGWVEMAVGLPEGFSYPGHSPQTMPPEQPQKGSTQLL